MNPKFVKNSLIFLKGNCTVSFFFSLRQIMVVQQALGRRERERGMRARAGTRTVALRTNYRH